MKIYAIADLDSDWYPKNAFTLFKRYSSLEFVGTPEEADLIWIFSYYSLISPLLRVTRLERLLRKTRLDKLLPKSWMVQVQIRKHHHPIRRDTLHRTPIIGSLHHLYHPKEHEYLPRIQRLDAIADAIQFFSEINIRENQHYFRKPLMLLPYWIDLEQFKPLPSTERKRLREKYGLPQDRRIIGTFQRDTERDLVTPKHEKGPDILGDVLAGLDTEKFFVLLAGVRRDYLENRMTQQGMPFKNVGLVRHEQMNELYNCLDYYLVTSRAEGGPQAILEAMAAKTPIYSTPVGIAELLDQKAVFSEAEGFIRALHAPYPDVLEAHYAAIQPYECRRVVGQFEAAFADLVAAYHQDPQHFYRHTQHIQWFNTDG